MSVTEVERKEGDPGEETLGEAGVEQDMWVEEGRSVSQSLTELVWVVG